MLDKMVFDPSLTDFNLVWQYIPLHFHYKKKELDSIFISAKKGAKKEREWKERSNLDGKKISFMLYVIEQKKT